MFAQLGNVQFELRPLTELEEKFAYHYAEHQVVEGKPLLQFIGDNLDEVSIGIRLHFTFCDPETVFNTLKAEGDRHQALPFFFATGKIVGRYVITGITKTTTITADNGRPLCIEAKLQLKEFFLADPQAAQQSAKQQAAPGLQGKGPVTAAVPAAGNKTALLSGQITADAAQIKKDAAKINTLTASIEGAAASAAAQIKAATAGITATVGPIMTQVQALAKDAQGVSGLIQGYAGQIAGYSSAIATVTAGLPGPLKPIGQKIGALNSSVSSKSTGIITMSQQAGGAALNTDTKAKLVQGLLP